MEKRYENLRSIFGKLKDSGRERKEAQPSYLKMHKEGGEIIKLPEVDPKIIKNNNLYSVILSRETRRLFDDEKQMTLKELSFILKLTQGVRGIREDNNTLKRYVPSASGRHSYESYIIANNVENLERNVYRYLPLDHSLLISRREKLRDEDISEALHGQIFANKASVVLVWAAIPYRMEWRFGSSAEKLILLDGGHIGQNFYLAAEALGLGACVIADYSQEKLDRLIGIDGENEISTYVGVCGVRRY